ncbi:hypothetical protein [Paraburkholderia caledonica]|uniref:Uncharacterized protein n=1 Tax=Paraburkholderia caledonica TaxID=134536 RepID=A0AB73IMR0_9BURK|nr:hypothetical protein [Paraburkholderia caledonica]
MSGKSVLLFRDEREKPGLAAIQDVLDLRQETTADGSDIDRTPTGANSSCQQSETIGRVVTRDPMQQARLLLLGVLLVEDFQDIGRVEHLLRAAQIVVVQIPDAGQCWVLLRLRADVVEGPVLQEI